MMEGDDMERTEAAKVRERRPAREGWIWRVIFEPSERWGLVDIAFRTVLIVEIGVIAWALVVGVGVLKNIQLLMGR